MTDETRTVTLILSIAIWFSELYYHSRNGIDIEGFWRTAMIFVGVFFVVNSLDSLICRYTRNLDLTVASYSAVKRLGRMRIAAS